MKKTPNRLLSFPLLLAFLLCLLSGTTSAFAVEKNSTIRPFSPETDTTAPAIFLIDTSFETVLFERESTQRRPIASITKVMTALLTLEAIERGELKADQIITAGPGCRIDLTPDSSTQNIQPGEQMSVTDLLYCLMVPSANEAANILAEAVAGTVPAFVERMNSRAPSLGMTNSHFMNPHGLHHEDHYSSAYDVYLMTREALRHPLFQKIVASPSYTAAATNMSGERTMTNTNALLTTRRTAGFLYEPATGVKTGSTLEAGYCVVSSAQQNERSLICVVLGAGNPLKADGTPNRLQFGESRTLLQWAFSDFKPQVLINKDSMLCQVAVKNGRGTSHVIGVPNAEVERIMPTSYDPALLQREITLNADTISAPVTKGQVLGTVNLTYEGQHHGSYELVATNDIALSPLRMLLNSVTSVLGSAWFWLGVVALFGLIFLRYRRAVQRRARRTSKSSNISHIDSAKRHPNGTPPRKPPSKGGPKR